MVGLIGCEKWAVTVTVPLDMETSISVQVKSRGGGGQGRVCLATGDGVAALLVGLHGDERGVNICLVRLDPGAMHRVQSQGRGRDKLQADDDFFVSD